jgi:hypothetical protein
VAAYLGLLAHHLGDSDAAREFCQQALQTFEAVQSQSQRQYRAFALMVFGHTCRELGLAAEAKAAYQESLTLRSEGGQPNLAMESRAGLAGVLLDEESSDLAAVQVDEILQHLQSGTLEGAEEAFKVYLVCYQVLKVKQDRRAENILAEAYSLLQAQAAKIADEELQHSFLHNVAANWGIVSEFETTTPIDSPS